MSFQSMRTALPYMGETSILRHTVLRKRIKEQQKEDEVAIIGEEASDEDLEPEGLPMVSLRVCLPAYISTASELLEQLSVLIGADIRQIRVLSTHYYDMIEGSRSCQIIFTLLEPSADMQYVRSSANYSTKLISKLPIVQATHLLILRTAPSLRTVTQILQTLQELTEAESGNLRKLGVQSVFIQTPSAYDQSEVEHYEGKIPVHSDTSTALYHRNFTPHLSPFLSSQPSLVNESESIIDILEQEEEDQLNDDRIRMHSIRCVTPALPLLHV